MSDPVIRPEPQGPVEWTDIKPRHVFTIVALLLFAALFYLARGVLGPYILAIVLSYFILPVVNRLETLLPRQGWVASARRPLATLISLVLLVIAFGLLLTYLIQPVIRELNELADALPGYWEDFTEGRILGSWYRENVPEDVQAWVDENTGQIGQRLLEGLTSVLQYFFSSTGNVVSAVAAFVIVPVFIAYFLIDRPNALARLGRNLPQQWADDAVEIVRLMDGTMAAYTRAVVILSFIVGVVTGVGYWAIGIELWIALGIIAFLGEIVPILGPWIAFFISFPIILATQPDKAIFAVILFGGVQALEGWFLAPKIEGHIIQFPPTVVLLSLALGGAVAGALGVVLALPVAAIIREITIYTMRRLDGARPSEASAGLMPESQQEKVSDIEQHPNDE